MMVLLCNALNFQAPGECSSTTVSCDFSLKEEWEECIMFPNRIYHTQYLYVAFNGEDIDDCNEFSVSLEIYQFKLTFNGEINQMK